MKDTTGVFGEVGPFYAKSPYPNVKPLLKQIENEFSIPIEKYRYFLDAFGNDVVVINKELVFRFPRTEEKKKWLKYEIEFLKMLKGMVSIPIPKYTYISKAKDFAGYKLIPGSLLSPKAFHSLSKKNQELVVDQIIGFLNDFHSISITKFRMFHPTERSDFIEHEKKVEKALREKLLPKLPANEVKIIEQFYADSRPYFHEIPTICPIHGDMYAFNTLYDKKTGKIGIIDFSDIQIGDPACDFEVFYDYGPEIAAMAYEKYTGPKDNNFLKRGEIIYKLHAILTLLSTQFGALLSFDFAHMRFRQKFGLQKKSL